MQKWEVLYSKTGIPKHKTFECFLLILQTLIFLSLLEHHGVSFFFLVVLFFFFRKVGSMKMNKYEASVPRKAQGSIRLAKVNYSSKSFTPPNDFFLRWAEKIIWIHRARRRSVAKFKNGCIRNFSRWPPPPLKEFVEFDFSRDISLELLKLQNEIWTTSWLVRPPFF